jgi:thiamine biosynthesis protein ThiS
MAGHGPDSDQDRKMLSFDCHALHGSEKSSVCLKLVVQGKELDYQGPADMLSLLEFRGENTLYTNVRINGEVLNERDFKNIDLHDGDNIDILYFMGGGIV